MILASVMAKKDDGSQVQPDNYYPRVKIETTMIVIYRIDSDDKIVSLRAFWDYKSMEEQILKL